MSLNNPPPPFHVIITNIHLFKINFCCVRLQTKTIIRFLGVERDHKSPWSMLLAIPESHQLICCEKHNKIVRFMHKRQTRTAALENPIIWVILSFFFFWAKRAPKPSIFYTHSVLCVGISLSYVSFMRFAIGPNLSLSLSSLHFSPFVCFPKN